MMPFPFDKKDRHVIPRWRDSRTTAALGEMDSIGTQVAEPIDDRLVQLKAAEWANHRSVSFASDIVATALSSGTEHPAAHEAAEFLLSSTDASPAAKIIARRFLGLTLVNVNLLESYPQVQGVLPLEERHRRIHRLRKELADSPRNVLLRADLALEYTAVGRRDKALQMMEWALRLSPDNRFLLRSAARLLVHVRDSDAALDILRRSSVSRHDPWLMAAEIAISGLADRGSRLAKMGTQVVGTERFTPFHMTELASALGTLEAEAGARKKSKRLFRQSLIAPTENSVAQATWASQRLDFDEFDPEVLRLPGSFEARALESLRSGYIESSIGATWKWLRDQYFSPAAAIFGSYISAIGLEDHSEALRFIDEGRMANKDDWLLLNNLAFSLASLNQIGEAEAILDTASQTSGDVIRAATLQATKGLILFRKGLTWAGREAYLGAAHALEQVKEPKAAAIAKLFRAREEIVAKTEEAEVALKEAQEDAKLFSKSPELLLALNRIERSFKELQALKAQ